MNEKEQKAADALLEKLTATTDCDEAVSFASAYLALTQGAATRKNTEKTSG